MAQNPSLASQLSEQGEALFTSEVLGFTRSRRVLDFSCVVIVIIDLAQSTK
jgi:hypothetical protein